MTLICGKISDLFTKKLFKTGVIRLIKIHMQLHLIMKSTAIRMLPQQRQKAVKPETLQAFLQPANCYKQVKEEC